MSQSVYLWAVFVWLSRVFACNEQTASSRTTWRIQILSFILAQAAGSWFHVWEPSQVGIFFSEMLSAKELVEDIRGERARREKGREREESEPEMYGCEMRRLRLRDKKGGPSPHKPLRRRRKSSSQPVNMALTQGMQGSRAVLGTVSWAGFSSVLPSGRAVMFSTVLTSKGSLPQLLCASHALCLPVLLPEEY